jgi:hypothetical protein
LTNWTDMHVRTMLVLKGRVDHWFQRFTAGTPEERHKPATRVKFFEAFWCWFGALKEEAAAKGEPTPDPQMHLRAILGEHSSEFAVPEDWL